MRVPDTIAIELEAAGDSRSTFRLRVDSTVVGGNLTAAQAQLLVGDILERIALPNRGRIGGGTGPLGRNECALAPIGEKSISQADAARVVASLSRAASASASIC